MADDLRRPSRAQLQELGVSGTKILSGIVFQETIPALQGLNAFRTYQQMRFDPSCAAMKKAIELPIRSARHFIEPASDAPGHIEHADFIHDMLWETGSQSFDDAWRLALTSLDFGFAAHEIVYMPLDHGPWAGKIGWDKFAWRDQSTKWRWNMGEVQGRQELVSMTQLAPPFYRQIDIPRNKLLLFVNDLEGDNYDGWSMYRPAYKPWFYRERLYRIQAIGLERTYMGVPVATLTDYSDDLISAAQSIVQNLMTDEQAGVTLPPEVTLEILKTALGSGKEMQDAIDHHSRQILLSNLAQFLDLGSHDSGSYALSSSHSELFLQAINAKANNLDEQLNLDPGIPTLISLNFPDADYSAMPRKARGDIGQRDLAGLGRTLMALGQWGFLTPDDATEDKLRQMLDFPERDNTVSERALHDLLTQVFPNQSVTTGVQHKSPRPLSPAEQKAKGVEAAPEPSPEAEQGATKMSEYLGLRARKPWDRPTGRLSETDRIRIKATEAFAEALEPYQGPGQRPERPSIVAARNRRPYVLMTEDPAKDRKVISQVNKAAKSGNLTPTGQKTSGVVPTHQLGLRKHKANLREVFAKQAKRKAKDVSVPKGTKLDDLTKG